jgi:hypothetical protein
MEVVKVVCKTAGMVRSQEACIVASHHVECCIERTAARCHVRDSLQVQAPAKKKPVRADALSHKIVSPAEMRKHTMQTDRLMPQQESLDTLNASAQIMHSMHNTLNQPEMQKQN